MKSHTQNETSEVFRVGLADIASHYGLLLCVVDPCLYSTDTEPMLAFMAPFRVPRAAVSLHILSCLLHLPPRAFPPLWSGAEEAVGWVFSIIPPYYLSVNLEVASYQEAPAILLSLVENWTYTATLSFSHGARIQTPSSREFEQQALIQQAIPSDPPFYFVA